MKRYLKLLNLVIQKNGESKKLMFLGIILITFLIIVLLLWQIKQHTILTKAESARKAGKPIPVNVYEVDTGQLDFFIPVECTLRSSALIPVYSHNRYNEIVKTSFVEVNDKVEKGQLLIELDADLEILELREAEKHLTLLTKEAVEGHKQYMDWSKRNRDKGYGLEQEYLRSKIDWLHARTLVEKARSEAKLKQKQINRKKISAPAKSVVVEVVKPGQATLVGTVSLITLAVVDPILMECPVSEDNLRYIAPGQSVEVSFYSYAADKYHGKIAYIKPVADAEQRSVSVFIEIPNADTKLLPGLHGIAQISKTQKTLRIPSAALLAGANTQEAQVFVVDAEQRVHIRLIKTGVYANGFTEVISGLHNGEQLVVAGQLYLRVGDKVRIVSKAAFSDIE